MDKDKFLKIIIIAGFCTVILTPLSLAVMWFFTDWKKKVKIIISAVSAFVYAATIALVLFLVLTPKSQQNSGRYGAATTEFSFSEGGGGAGFLPSDSGKGGGKKSKEKKSEEKKGTGSSSSSAAETNFKRVFFPLLFFVMIIVFVIVQNMRSKKKSVYENPYVDTKKIILPLTPDFKFPMVHYSRLELGEDEKILFVTETNQSGNEGDLIITDCRVVLLKKTEGVEIYLDEIKSFSTVSNTVIQLAIDENKYYAFMHESQVPYVLAILEFLKK